tara:strand:+ start:3186 stop:3851 length:666 start_codon:yes stop_codon:yes gene_type:complete
MKKILVTGTSSGLGYQIAETLTKKYNIVGLSRSIGKAKNINKKKFKFINLDLSNFKEFEKLDKIKDIDCLINNSAIFSLKNFESISQDEIIKTININMIGTILLTKKILKNNKKLKKIINILSVSGLNGIKNQTIYSATKHGLKGFFDSLSQEKINQISIYNIFPGGMKTDLWKNIRKVNKKKILKFLNVSEISKLIEFLLTQKNSTIYKNITVFPNNDWH